MPGIPLIVIYTSHSLFSSFTAYVCIPKHRRSSPQCFAANPSGFTARLEWDSHQPGHTVVILLYTPFILPIAAICPCLAASQTFVACTLHNSAILLCVCVCVFKPEALPIRDSGHLGFNWISACLSCVTVRSYLPPQTSDWVESKGSKH